jgi:DNA adenine methylase
MSKDLLNMLDEAENYSGTDVSRVLKGPFSWPGAKNRSLEPILNALPYDKGYIEVFGGSGVVLLNRRPSPFECFNDRNSAVTDFYRCIKDREKLAKLIELVKASINSKELFLEYRDTWITTQDPVERAYRWIYSIMLSFGKLGRNWGRNLSDSTLMPALFARCELWCDLHGRLKNVQIENADWQYMLERYDDRNAVFYLDPPYLNAYQGTYIHEMTVADHKAMLDKVFKMKAFVALSGFPNDLYSKYNWDKVIEWKVYQAIKSVDDGEGNCKAHLAGVSDRTMQTEKLWIKYHG